MNAVSSAPFDAAAYPSVLDAQVTELLRRVQTDCESRCRQMLSEAEAQKHEILRGARREARASVRQAISQERARIARSLRHAQANAAMHERLRAEQNALHLLMEMWKSLPGALQARWRDPDHRRVWIQSAAQQACTVLSNRSWRIEHGADVSEAECRAAIRQTCDSSAHSGPSAVECLLDSQIGAGIRIRAQEACVDATIAGLLANRSDIEAALLAELIRTDGPSAAEPPSPVQQPSFPSERSGHE